MAGRSWKLGIAVLFWKKWASFLLLVPEKYLRKNKRSRDVREPAKFGSISSAGSSCLVQCADGLLSYVPYTFTTLQ